MATLTRTKRPFNLSATIWILIVAVLLVVLAAMAVFVKQSSSEQ